MELVDLLKRVELFAGLNQEQLDRLARAVHRIEVHEGDVIFSRGEPGQQLYVIQEGQVEVIISDDPKKKNVGLVYLGQGQIFGEMALIDYGERSATIRCASTKAILAVLNRDDFEGLCAGDTAIGYIVMRNMASDLSFKLRHRNVEPKSG